MHFLMDSTKAAGDELAVDGIVPVGQLLTPLTRYKRWSDFFAIDNGAFSSFHHKAFKALLAREYEHRRLCKFVAVPDVVGDARRTLEVFNLLAHDLKSAGWPVALVLQDGIGDLAIPWRQLAAVFIGGTTKFKESDSAVACAKAARILGKWVHVGRVNTPDRWDKWAKIAHSVDGSGVSRYSHMRTRLVDHVRTSAHTKKGKPRSTSRPAS